VIWWLLLVLCIVLGLFIYLLRLPASTQVQRSILIQKPVAEVYAYVRNFEHWNAWSPWMIHEPDAKTTTVNGAAVGGIQTWDGKRIGAGQMQHVDMKENEELRLLITFMRPFKSKADAAWRFKSITADGQVATEVTWQLHCKMPIFFRPFLPFMALMIGHDFQLGLGFLRGQLDPSSDHPKLAFDGEVTLAPQLYLTEHFEGSLSDMRAVMQSAYPRLGITLQQDPVRDVKMPAIAAYHKVKPLKGWARMDMGVPISRANPGETSQTLGGGRYFQTTLKGSYEYMGCAWNAAYGHAKMRKLTLDRSRPALEFYALNPLQAQHSNDWVTQLCVPIK
jgi:Polyketide cyclase / dehydrase and lipid transport/GyrI-like small molecule binding domain